jgi:hypothetical protein
MFYFAGNLISVSSFMTGNTASAMKKIDILNFITNFRKAPNDIKTHSQLVAHLGADKEATMNSLLAELQQAKVVRQTELNGEKAYQVIAR